MSAILILILISIIILAIFGMGFSKFFSAVLKGAEKVNNIPVVRNITDTATSEINKVVKNVSKSVIDNIGNH